MIDRCITWQECADKMDTSWERMSKILGDEKSGMIGDLRQVRDAQIEHAILEAEREDVREKMDIERQRRQDKSNRDFRNILAVLSILVGLSNLSTHWPTIKAIFSSLTVPHIGMSIDSGTVSAKTNNSDISVR